MKDEAVRASQGRGVADQFEVVGIGGALLLEEKSLGRVQRVVETLGKDRRYLILTLEGNSAEQGAAKALVRESSLNHTEIRKLSRRIDDAPVLIGRVLGRDRGWTLAEKIGAGKRILHLAKWRSPFISAFKPPRGVVCHRFYKLVLGTECPYDCSYCYLQLTFRMAPYTRQYLNLEDLWAELERLNRETNKPILLNTGELADPLAVDHITGVVNEVVSQMSKHENLQLLLLTKSANVDHLQPVGNGRVVFSVSLTTPENVREFEHGTPEPYDRIEALRKAEMKGYRTRCRIDPIICARSDWEPHYRKLIEALFERTRVQMITLGQPRFHPPLLNLVRKRYPEAGKVLSDLPPWHGMEKLLAGSPSERTEVYRKILSMIDEYNRGNRPLLMVCKEDQAIVRALEFRPGRCNCLA
jgi:spore photoproduct lyase